MRPEGDPLPGECQDPPSEDEDDGGNGKEEDKERRRGERGM